MVARADRRRARRRTGSTSTSATSRPTSCAEDEIWQPIVDARRPPADGRARPDRRRSTRSPTGPTSDPDDVPVELHPRPRRQSPAGRRRLPGRAGAASRTAARCSTPTRWPGSTSSCAATSTTCSSAPRCRSCCRPGLHDLEAIDEALAQGAWGRAVAPGSARRLRAGHRPRALGGLQRGLRRGLRAWSWRWPRASAGRPPQTITFLSGDVHNSYVAEVDRPELRPGAQSRIVQAVCSPIRNPLPRGVRVAHVAARHGAGAARCGSSSPARTKVPEPALPWTVTDGPVVRQQPRHPPGPGPWAGAPVGRRGGRGASTRD